MNTQNLIAGDIVKLSSGDCYFYAGFIPAQGHYVKDAWEKTILIPKHEVPVLVQRQEQPSPKRSQYELYIKLKYEKKYFPHDETY